jgi:group I intron endonuclease
MENEEKIGYVYMITSQTGRIYIGSTINIKQRKTRYKNVSCETQPKLYRSLLKYGFEAHSFEVIWFGNAFDMKQKECILGHFYDCLDTDKGLNLKLPDLHEVFCCMSIETRNKMSESGKGRVISEETRQKLRIANKGQIPSEASREATRNRVYRPEIIEKLRSINIGNENRLKYKVICAKTGVIFPNVKSAALLIGITPNSLRRILKGQRKNNTTFKFYEN